MFHSQDFESAKILAHATISLYIPLFSFHQQEVRFNFPHTVFIFTVPVIKFQVKLLVDSFLLTEIDDSIADMFGKDIWPNIQSGIFEALNRLINL